MDEITKLMDDMLTHLDKERWISFTKDDSPETFKARDKLRAFGLIEKYNEYSWRLTGEGYRALELGGFESILKTKKFPLDKEDYPDKHGIYGFVLTGKSDLGDFGKKGTLIYIGIAKESLRDRDLKQHFRNGQTGRSTLRRSIGAILKSNLKLTAIPRGLKTDSKRFLNYKFKEADEDRLTRWMTENLEVGYWTANESMTYKELREYEKKITMELKPTLDLDKRTIKYNSLAYRLTKLRTTCVDESKTEQ
jgi:hypothetical protein